MRGATSKLLRKAGVDTKKDKRMFNAMSHRNKAIFLDFLRTSLRIENFKTNLVGKGIDIE